MKLKLANSLTAGVARLSNIFKSYYQWIFPAKDGQIVDTTAINYGTGETDADVAIGNTQVATFDGVITLGFTDLTGVTITDSSGTSTPTINGNNIEFTIGYCIFTLSTGDVFYGQESNGLKLYGTKGLVGTLSSNVGVWANTLDDVHAALQALGYDVYAETGDLETQSKWIYVVLANGQSQTINIPVGYEYSHTVQPNAGFSDTGNLLQNKDNVGLNAVFEKYGLLLKNSDGWFSFDYLKSLNGYPYPNNITQAFLKESTYFEDNELKDYSNTPVNAKLWGYELRGVPLINFTLENVIVLDYGTDGLKWEVVVSRNTNDGTWFCPLSKDDNIATMLMGQGGGYLYVWLDDNVKYTLTFAAGGVPKDGEYYRIKCEVSGDNITLYTADWDDVNYASATSDTISLTTIPQYNASTNPVKQINVTGIMPSSTKVNGALVFVECEGYKFYCQDKHTGTGSLGGNKITSIGNVNQATMATAAPESWQYQDKIIPNTEGFTRVIDLDGAVEFNLSYLNGESQAEAFETWANRNVAFEEYEEGKLGEGFAFTIDASMETYDQGNTYFDTGSNANKITASKQPSKLNSRIYWDRKYNKDILLYDSDVTIENTINTIDKDYLSIGDSVAGNYWTALSCSKLGMNLDVSGYFGGRDTENVLIELQSAVASEPTLISSKDFITVCCAFNDYAQDTSKSQLLIDYRALVDYVLSENSTAVIICCGVYNWGNPIDNGTTPNNSGLTMDGIREVIEQVATERGAYYVNFNDAPIIQEDIPDNIHPGSSTGNYKLSKMIVGQINNIDYGNGIVIPKEDYQHTISADGRVITDIVVQPYEPDHLVDINDEILLDENNEKLYPLKEF